MIVFAPIHDFSLGGFPISVHGLLIAAGFVVAEILARYSAKRRGISPEIVDNASLIAVAAGMLGARLAYLVFFGQGMSFAEMLQVWNGGLSSHGGYVFGIAAGLIYVWRKKIDVRAFADAVIPYMLIGWAVGRIGCFLNWDSFGQAASSALSVVVYGEPRYPTQLFESFGYLVSFALVRAYGRLRPKAIKQGDMAALALGFFALTRFAVDFFRADPFGYLLLSRVIAVTVIAAAAVFIFCAETKRNS